MGDIWSRLCLIVLMTAAMFSIVWYGIFDDVMTENGPDHYAEKPWGPLQETIPMPLNTVINFAYIIVGSYWLFAVFRMETNSVLSPYDATMFYPFLWMAVFYGPIQLGRIITQQHRWAVMDQWYTLPFFAWASVWGLHILHSKSRDHANNANTPTKTIQSDQLQTTIDNRSVAIMLLSLLSYTLSLLCDIGFDIALGFHIVSAVTVGVKLYIRNRTRSTTYALSMATISCSIFVIFKVLDHYLPNLHEIFTVISGHFISKIGDVMQIHFTALFFYECLVRDRSGKRD